MQKGGKHEGSAKIRTYRDTHSSIKQQIYGLASNLRRPLLKMPYRVHHRWQKAYKNGITNVLQAKQEEEDLTQAKSEPPMP